VSVGRRTQRLPDDLGCRIDGRPDRQVDDPVRMPPGAITEWDEGVPREVRKVERHARGAHAYSLGVLSGSASTIG
jgi:hypothetical protein